MKTKPKIPSISMPIADIFAPGTEMQPEAVETQIKPIQECKCGGIGYFGKNPVKVCMYCYLKLGAEQYV